MNPDTYAVVCVTQSSYDLILHYRAVRYPALAMFILVLCLLLFCAVFVCRVTPR